MFSPFIHTQLWQEPASQYRAGERILATQKNRTVEEDKRKNQTEGGRE
jgi:hypothetical protein